MDGSQRFHWWQHSTLKPALASSVLCWLAFPPVGWAGVVWIAPIGWLALIARVELSGKRPYRAIWLAGFVFWMLTLHWIRLPHAVNYLGWPALSSYLACYLPTFVALARVGVHRLRLPLWLVAPAVWTGLDFVRARLFTGFLMGSLAHTQVEFLPVVQIARLVGEYGVSFLIVFVAACIADLLLQKNASLPNRLVPLSMAALSLLIVMMWGTKNLTADLVNDQLAPLGPRVGLIQGNALADWKSDAEKQQRIMLEQMELSLAAMRQAERDGRPVDLVIWPETAFRQSLVTVAEGYQPPAERIHESFLTAGQRDLAEFVRQTGAALLSGIDRVHISPDVSGQPEMQGYNSSVLVDRQGKVVTTYDKMHLVIMGEYVPFADWIPWLQNLTPITGFAKPGEAPQAMSLDGFVFCPNICYETVVPHLIRQQVTQLAEQGSPPDALVNLTNDAWFWGSSELEMHLACGIFRAIEMRTPLVIAANGGLSAHVDAYGTVQQITPRQEPATLIVDLAKRTGGGLTFYARWGDWFAGACVVCCVVLAIVGWRSRERH